MAQEHDDWMRAFGIDLDQLGRAAGRGAPPTLDPAVASATLDSTKEFGTGFAKGASDTAGAIVNSPAGQMANPLATPEHLLDAAISGDPSKLVPESVIPTAGALDDPKAQDRAVQMGDALVQSVLDPIGSGIDAGIATAAELATGDPEQVGEATGKAVVIGAAAAVPAAAEAGLAGDLGLVEDGAAARPATSPGPVSSPDVALDSSASPSAPAEADPGLSPGAQSVSPGEVSPTPAAEPAPDADGAPAVPQDPPPGPISSLDPALDVPLPSEDAPTLIGDPPTVRTPELDEQVAPTERQPGISPAAESVDAPTARTPQLDDQVAPTEPQPRA